MELELSNVINISVSAAPTGLGAYNTSNLALFTKEVPDESFGDDGFKIYLDPAEVATDFGSSSATYKMALAVFSQAPNILANSGYLVVILIEQDLPAVTAQQLVTFSSVPTVGNYKLKYGANATANIAYSANAAAVQTALRLVSGLSSVTVTGDTSVGFTIVFTGVTGPATLLTVTSDTLQDTLGVDVFLTVVTTVVGQAAGTETLGAAITRTKDLVQYFGILPTAIQDEDDTLEAAAVVQTLNKILGIVSRTEADVETGGLLDLIRSGGFTYTRGLLYLGATDLSALEMSAAYFGRALSTVFSGSNTTQTMHLKDLRTIQPDPDMTQTILTKALSAGADTYVSLQGIAKVFCSGENSFFDDVYNLQWFVGALQVAGFNALATTSTKLPQTEQGVAVLKGAYRQVCEQGVGNQYLAPGQWNSPTTFGNQGDFFRNISERGYYIYSAPVALQSAADRAARIAPLIQIAVKEAGAIHSSSVIIYVNV